MEPLYFKVPRLKDHSIRIAHWDLPHFFDPVHYHEDCQITIILKGSGTLIAGHNLNKFKPGDVLLFGKNLPHVIRDEVLTAQSIPSINARAISIFFNDSPFLEITEKLPELQVIHQLISAMNFGLKISSIQTKSLLSLIKSSEDKKDADRILFFMALLNRLAASKTVIKLSSSATPVSGRKNRLGLNKVFEYMLDNYHKPITLNEMAQLCNMAPTAFCRFFKHSTQKTFSSLLTEIRIEKVCKIITEENGNFTEAYLRCGYNNGSNFYRHFKKIMGMTPTAFKNAISTTA
ncbi:helix-turn-helix domain-containing protein [bacterium]|nr:helix-turn-helix domain-containing protein [bacterium]